MENLKNLFDKLKKTLCIYIHMSQYRLYLFKQEIKMLRKFIISLVLTPAFICLSGCQVLRSLSVQDVVNGNWDNPQQTTAEAPNKTFVAAETKRPTSIVVCRSHQCAPAKLSMSREYIFNSLLQLFDNNNYQRMLVCQADPMSHTCLENYITIPISVGIVPTKAYIDQIKITDVIVGKKGSSLNLILNYNLSRLFTQPAYSNNSLLQEMLWQSKF